MIALQAATSAPAGAPVSQPKNYKIDIEVTDTSKPRAAPSRLDAIASGDETDHHSDAASGKHQDKRLDHRKRMYFFL